MNTTAAPQGFRRLRGGAVLPIALTAIFGALVCVAYAIKAVRTEFIADDAAFTASLVTSVATGLILVLRRPGNRVGWIVCLLAWAMSAQEFIESYMQLAVLERWSVTAVAWIDGKTFLWLWGGMIALFLYFPTGQLPSPRWRVPARLALSTVVTGFVAMALVPGPLLEDPVPGVVNPLNPTALPSAVWQRVGFIEPVALLLLVAAFVLAIASLVVRYRSSNALQRLQIRWVVTASATFAVVMLLSVAVRHLRPELLDAADVASGLAFTLVPVSIAVAVLRFRLYEIDRVISRTVVYAVLTLVLGAAYLGAVTAIRPLTAGLTGDSAPAVAVSTLGVAALFRPARRRIQDVVDRRFNRARYDAATTVARFSGRLRDEIDVDALRLELQAVVMATMQPSSAVLWLREASR